MKKKISIFILIIYIFMVATNMVFAADSFSAYITNNKNEIKPGEEIELKINVSDINMSNDGINIIEGILNYNRDVFEEVTTSDIKTEDSWQVTYNSINGKFIVINYNNSTKEDTMVFTLNLRAKANIKEITQEEISISNITSNNEKELINAGTKSVTIKIVPDISKEEQNGSSIQPTNNVVIDDTTAKGTIPKTGINPIVIIVILVVIGISVFAFIKHKNISKILVLIIPLVAISILKNPVEAVGTGVLKTYFYTIDTNKKMISRVEPKTNIEEFKERFYVDDSENINIYSDSNKVTEGIITTGMQTKYADENYTVSVVGDIDGDGEATQEELGYTIRHILGFEGAELTGVLYESADINGDGLLDQRDIKKYVEFVVNGKFDLEKIDEMPPTISLNVKETTKNSINVEAVAIDREEGMEDDINYTFYIKEKNSSEYTQVKNAVNTNCIFTGLKENTEYKIKCIALDKVGNEGEVTISAITNEGTSSTDVINENTDTISPTLKVNYSLATRKIIAQAFATDEQSGIAEDTKYKFSIKNADNVNGDYELVQETTSNRCEFKNLVEGRSYIIKVEINDKAGNRTAKVQKIELLDNIPPIVNFSIEEETSCTITVKAVASDVGGMPNEPVYAFYIKKASDIYSSYTKVQESTSNICTMNKLEQGTDYIVRVIVKDKAGNETRTIASARTKLVPAPTIEVVRGTKDVTGWYTSNAALKIIHGTNIVNPVNIYSLTGATTKSETSLEDNGTITISNNGTTTITAYTYDDAQNKSPNTTLVINKDQGTPSYSNVSGQSKSTASHTHVSTCKHTHTSACTRTTYCSGSGSQVGYTYTYEYGGRTWYHHECPRCDYQFNDNSGSATIGNHGGSTTYTCGKNTTSYYCGYSPVTATVTLQKATNMYRTRAKATITNGTINSITWSGDYTKISDTEVIINSGTVTCTIGYTAGTSTSTGTTAGTATFTVTK